MLKSWCIFCCTVWALGKGFSECVWKPVGTHAHVCIFREYTGKKIVWLQACVHLVDLSYCHLASTSLKWPEAKRVIGRTPKELTLEGLWWVVSSNMLFSLRQYTNTLKNTYLVFILYVCMYICLCVCVCVCVRVCTQPHRTMWKSGNKWELVLSFHCVTHGDQSQVGSLAANALP